MDRLAHRARQQKVVVVDRPDDVAVRHSPAATRLTPSRFAVFESGVSGSTGVAPPRPTSEFLADGAKKQAKPGGNSVVKAEHGLTCRNAPHPVDLPQQSACEVPTGERYARRCGTRSRSHLNQSPKTPISKVTDAAWYRRGRVGCGPGSTIPQRFFSIHTAGMRWPLRRTTSLPSRTL